MVGGIRLSLTIRDGEVVELIRRRRWSKGVRCLTVAPLGMVVRLGGFTLNDTYVRAVGGSPRP
ncbi:MAG: hypothetical protein QXX13_08780 [Candidatus Methanomethylicia archaeon]